MEEKKKKEIPSRFFRVDKEFLKELDEILKKHFVFGFQRKGIIEDFVKLIKAKIREGSR